MSELPSSESPKSSLFRQQAMDAQQTSNLGRIVLIRPFSFTVITTVSVILALLLISLFYFGSYTRRTSVTGQLMPVQGLVRVFPIQTGIVTTRTVQEGQKVQQGELLYTVSSERTSGQGEAIQAQISQQVTQRAESVRLEIEKTRRVHQDEYTQQQNRVVQLQRELAQLKVCPAAALCHKSNCNNNKNNCSTKAVACKRYNVSAPPYRPNSTDSATSWTPYRYGNKHSCHSSTAC